MHIFIRSLSFSRPMRVIRTSVNDEEFLMLMGFCDVNKISMYALLKMAVFEYVKEGAAASGHIEEIRKVRKKASPYRLIHSKEYEKAVGELRETEEGRFQVFTLTMERICALPQEKFDAYMASLEGLLKQVESEKPP